MKITLITITVFSVNCVARMLIDGLQYTLGDLSAPDGPANKTGRDTESFGFQ